MKMSVAALGLLATTMATPVLAGEGPVVHAAIPKLSHVFIIMMENHGYAQIIGNPNAPFINSYVKKVNHATNYYGVAHPSLTNYLEIVGGSNFGVQDDNSPDWYDTSCKPNLATGIVSDESVSTAICPISGTGTDAETPAIDTTNETSGPPGLLNLDGYQGFVAAPGTVGKTIADQLFAAGMTWKTYQQNAMVNGSTLVNNANGVYSNRTNFGSLSNNVYTPPGGSPDTQITSGGVVALYAVKHNPFAYFRSIQNGPAGNNMSNVVNLDQLFQDLGAGQVPSFSFIVPDQCHDQHGKSGDEQYCNGDADDNGTQVGLNPGLITAGDVTVQKIVTAIHASKVWAEGNDAIVVVWDENDYYTAPETNKVVMTVDTNYGSSVKVSNKFYTHFSLLKTIESGFGLPCLNHACDSATNAMSDLFSKN
jgi:hypothetical protein